MIAGIVVLSVITLIITYISIEIIKYNKQIKKDERFNNRSTPRINQERYNIKGSEEISSDKVQDKHKSRSSNK